MAAVSEYNRKVIEEFRANGGEVGGDFAGMALLLLTTTGARSREARTTPVAYLRDGERLVVFASKAGAPTNPAWYHNLLASPAATVEVGRERFAVRARVTSGEERERLFSRQAELVPQFADYARKTSRQIPVVSLERDG
jgi:deazaflavin-dependent oxidoreductase (nitroreductase family)